MFSRSLISSSRQTARSVVAPRFAGLRSYTTPSEEAVKHGDKHTKDPKELQKETAAKAHSQKSDGKETHSEDAVHGSKHDKSPEELARETAAKAKK